MPIDLAKVVGGGGGGPELWVSGQTYAVGEQAISQTDFGVYIRKVAGAGTVNPASDSANWQPFGGRAIKSIQRGTVSVYGGNTSNVTISAVNPAKTELRLLSASFGAPYRYGGNGSVGLIASANMISLLNSTTIQTVGGNSNAGLASSVSISWELTEYH